MTDEKELIEQTNDLVAMLGSLIAQSKEDNIQLGSRILQATIKGRGWKQIRDEAVRLIGKGKHLDGTAPESADYLWELWKFIDMDVPDEVRLNAMKNIFFRSVDRDNSQDERALAYQLMRICRKLSSLDITVLQACYELKKRDEKARSYNEWRNFVAGHIGFIPKELVDYVEGSLTNNKLLTERTASDRSGIGNGSQTFRLTDLGIKLCEYIEDYEA